MGFTRMILLLALTVYLVCVPFILSAIGNSYGANIGTSSNNTELNPSFTGNDTMGMTTSGNTLKGSFLGNFVTGVSLLPAGLNLVLIAIPSIFWLVLVILMFFPTSNAGG
jgi:hypothetical protein